MSNAVINVVIIAACELFPELSADSFCSSE